MDMYCSLLFQRHLHSILGSTPGLVRSSFVVFDMSLILFAHLLRMSQCTQSSLTNSSSVLESLRKKIPDMTLDHKDNWYTE